MTMMIMMTIYCECFLLGSARVWGNCAPGIWVRGSTASPPVGSPAPELRFSHCFRPQKSARVFINV